MDKSPQQRVSEWLETFPPITASCPNDAALPPAAVYAHQNILSLQEHARAWAEITAWPGYTQTPCLSLAPLAAALGLGDIWYKHENDRFGLGSFKALGGAYAVYRLLQSKVQQQSGLLLSADELRARARDQVASITVTCATDGNHGRSVAWGAQLFGCQCVIYIHALVSEGRQRAIEKYGAKVIRVAGNYDDAVRQADHDARAHGWTVVSDTSYPGYTEIPKHVMQGYTVMVEEVLRQLPAATLPTHVFVQGGVGGLAAAVCAHLWERLGTRRPRFVVVEPDQADCIYQSVGAGKLMAVHGDLNTIMAGLACGEVSTLAWQILKPGMNDVVTLSDDAAAQGMRMMASAVASTTPIAAGESAVAGLAALIGLCRSPELRDAFALNDQSRVLLFGTEGATDPELYRRIVNRDASEVEASDRPTHQQ